MAGLMSAAEQPKRRESAPPPADDAQGGEMPMGEQPQPGQPAGTGDAELEGLVKNGKIPGQEKASPEEQQAFDAAKAVGMKAITAKGQMDRLLSMVKKNGLNNAAGTMIANIVVQVDKKMQLPKTTILPLGTSLAAYVLEAVSRSKIIKVTPESAQAMMGAVFTALAQAYGAKPEDAARALKKLEARNGSAQQGG
ncbi:MAG: hypothetical protein RJQ08_13635 [Salinisphaeraceae bacterium]